MILTDPDDFRIRNHDFSGAATNCPVLVIEAVQNVKITVFSRFFSNYPVLIDIS